jgi:hypothetical protein
MRIQVGTFFKIFLVHLNSGEPFLKKEKKKKKRKKRKQCKLVYTLKITKSCAK